MEEEHRTLETIDSGRKPLMVVIGLLIAGVLVIGGGLLAFRGDSTENSTSSTPAKNELYSKEDVAMHTTKSDCWTYIGTNVYDLTSYVSRHQGGDEILRACGKDGTSLFENRTTDSGEKVGSGTSHSRSAESQLAQLKIGTLK